MDVHRYESNSVAEGMLRVRRELGTDAEILSVEQTRNPGRRGRIRITARATTSTPQMPDAAAASYRSNPPETDDGAIAFDGQKILADIYAAQSRKAKVEPPKTKSRVKNSYALIDDAPSYTPSADTSTFDQILTTEPPSAPAGGITDELPQEVTSLYFYLLDIGIDPEIAEEIIERLCHRFDPNRGWQPERVHDFLSNLVAGNIRVGGTLGHGRKKRVVALVGPTGVGKTTTIAKLATRLASRNISVGLITVDNFRVGAVDQLRKFASALSQPLLVATNPKEFVSSLRAFRTRQVVLVDTAGQNPRDPGVLDRLNGTLNAAEGIERHLVLAATTKERDLKAYADLYRSVGFEYLLFSKLDETATYGGLLNTHFSCEKPFSYFTTGQRVPDDIEEADADRLNGLLFN